MRDSSVRMQHHSVLETLQTGALPIVLHAHGLTPHTLLGLLAAAEQLFRMAGAAIGNWLVQQASVHAARRPAPAAVRLRGSVQLSLQISEEGVDLVIAGSLQEMGNSVSRQKTPCADGS